MYEGLSPLTRVQTVVFFKP